MILDVYRNERGFGGEQFRRNVQLGAAGNGQWSHTLPWYGGDCCHVRLGAFSPSLFAVDKMELSVDRVVRGSLMTSMEMAGVSLTLLKMEPGWELYIGQSLSLGRRTPITPLEAVALYVEICKCVSTRGW